MLYYLHGYQSSLTGEKATLLKETIGAIPIAYRDDPPEKLVISRCLSRISEALQNDDYVVLIGSSLGGVPCYIHCTDPPNSKTTHSS